MQYGDELLRDGSSSLAREHRCPHLIQPQLRAVTPDQLLVAK